MKPLSVFLVRHGESAGNVDKSVYVNTPDWQVPLTEKGISQATEAGKKLALLIKQRNSNLGVYLFQYYCSPWKRARQTATYAIKALEELYPGYTSTIKEDPRLREQEWGNFQEAHLQNKHREERYKYGSFFYRLPHGESGADVFDRVTTFIGTMHRDFENFDFPSNAIIFSHGLTIKSFLMKWFHWSVEDFEKYDTPDNCSIIQMDLQEDNKYKLMTELKLYQK